ncbi:putative disease resistance protein [Nymphaea thermarum]|nr:putative disease resistance protein [Nymphaea thermarum]
MQMGIPDLSLPRHEATLVAIVADHLQRHLDSGLLVVADHPVGMEFRIEDVMKLLQIERDGVKMVGLVGTGGIGKTTIAKAVFNKLRSNFGAASFLTNIRERWKDATARTQLMRQLVEEILDDRFTAIHDIESGQRLFLQRLPPKKLLIVLDDVDRVDEFQELIGYTLNRFQSRSRIIMTTRSEDVLSRCRVDGIYKPKLMDADQSLDLFKSYAFESSHQPQDMFVDMSMKVVAVAGGLPLALRVFGSYLSDKSDLAEWQDYLDKLQETPEQDILKCLQISYDALSNVEKWIFLDIACFFVGHSEVEATLMWENLNWQPRFAIKVLQKKSLITRVRDDGPFDMHDLIRDMGREVVRQVQPGNPWMWSRVWTADDTLNVLEENRSNNVTEGINLSQAKEEELSSAAFGKMKRLRVLRVNNVSFKGQNFMLPKALKVLFLRVTKIESLSRCNFENLVTLELHVADDMSELLVRESPSKVFNALKFLKISCHSIRVTPDFSNMPHLEKLEFSYCASLVEVHESIGKLTKLKYLMFLQFLNVEKLPDAICRLTSLQTLIIKQFPRLESLPERLGNLESLNTLELDDLAITRIPCSVGQLNKLSEMYLRKLDRLHCLPNSISSLNSLQVFDVEGTDLKGMKIDSGDLMDIDRLEISSCDWLSVLPASSLKKARVLCITDSKIKELPESIEAMEKIEELSLRCKNLMTLPDWISYPKNLKTFEADCESITPIINKIFSLRSIESLSLCCADEELPAAIAETSVENLKSFTLRCKNLKALPEWIGSLKNLEFLKFEACESITELPLCIRNLSRLEELSLNGCKRIRLVPLLPSSLLILDASNCSDLEKTLDISNLKSLKKLRLGGCRLLEDVLGIENAAQNMEELVLPGPYGSIGCSSLSDNFKEQVFKELAFERLRRFEIWGSLSPGSVTGHQQLSFMFPNGANVLKPELMMKRLVLNTVQSPIHIQLLEDDHRVVFESTLEVLRPIVKNFFRPIWIPLPRMPIRCIRYRGRLVFDGLGFIGVPCHGRCAVLSRCAIGGSEMVEEFEEVAEDGCENGGGRDGTIEDEHHEGGNEIRAYGPKIIQVFQPNRVPHFLASRPRFIHWRHECSAVSSDYEVNFGKEDEIQERLRTGSHATILVSADASNLTTVGMTFSFTGEE